MLSQFSAKHDKLIQSIINQRLIRNDNLSTSASVRIHIYHLLSYNDNNNEFIYRSFFTSLPFINFPVEECTSAEYFTRGSEKLCGENRDF